MVFVPPMYPRSVFLRNYICFLAAKVSTERFPKELHWFSCRQGIYGAFSYGITMVVTVTVKVFCTDRHMSIQKMMREVFKSIVHQYDVWHLAKSIANTQKAKKKEAEEQMVWVHAI